jgi:hypothetical protein
MGWNSWKRCTGIYALDGQKLTPVPIFLDLNPVILPHKKNRFYYLPFKKKAHLERFLQVYPIGMWVLPDITNYNIICGLIFIVKCKFKMVLFVLFFLYIVHEMNCDWRIVKRNITPMLWMRKSGAIDNIALLHHAL